MSKKNSSMQNEVEKGEQMPLMEVGPEHSKEIIKLARQYKKAQTARINALAEETKLKHELLGLIKEEHLKRLEDGTIMFTLEGYKITVTPRDELVKVKEDSEAA